MKRERIREIIIKRNKPIRRLKRMRGNADDGSYENERKRRKKMNNKIQKRYRNALKRIIN